MYSKKVRRFLIRGVAILMAAGCMADIADARSSHPGGYPPLHPQSAAVVTDQSRSEEYNDFLRAVWVSHGTSVSSTTLGIRAFFTATTFLRPPVTVDQFLQFVGNFYHDNQDFAIMRCRPTSVQRANVVPILATWPNVFPAVATDLGGPSHNCLSPGLTPGEQQICALASTYSDPSQTLYVQGLSAALQLGVQMFATPESTEALRRDYGIFPAFSGLGFTVQASAAPVTGATVPMTTAEILRNSVVPEYLLKRSTLADANCRCLQVPANENLHTAPLDPDFIWAFGELENGACRRINYPLYERARLLRTP